MGIEKKAFKTTSGDPEHYRWSNLKKEILVLEAKVKKLEQTVGRYKVKDDCVELALKRLIKVLEDPPLG